MTRIWKFLLSRFKFLPAIFVVVILSGCATIPIAKPIKYYSPRDITEIVDDIPHNCIYIGTIKMVPRGDASVRSERQKERVLRRLQREAAKVGADCVFITDIQRSNKDYLLDWNFSDGYTIEAEMFRRVDK